MVRERKKNPGPNPGAQDLDSHLKELTVARDTSDVRHIMPKVETRHQSILDIGCGMGQTLIGLGLPDGSQGYGIDLDADAIEAGKSLCPPNVHISVGSGENLQFPDKFFDLVICRVSLPYMHVGTALSEMHRVLKPGGDVWLVLHPGKMYTGRLLRSLKRGRLKDTIYTSYVVLNGLLFNATGKQVKFMGKMETFQSERGMRRALERAGFTCTNVARDAFFVVEGRK
jgi:ubiquinone/menaquinone biosynthesis C-methylase UbiE